MARRRRWKRKKGIKLTRLEQDLALLDQISFSGIDQELEDARLSLLRQYIRKDELTIGQKRYVRLLANKGKFLKRRDRFDKQETFFVYAISAGDHIKVGYAKNPRKRLKDMQVGNPVDMKLEATIDCKTYGNAKKLERQIHRAMKKHKVRGEWFTTEALKAFDCRDARFY